MLYAVKILYRVKMAVELRLRSLLDKIAREQGYVDHQLKVKQVSTEGANYSSLLFSSVLSAANKPELKLFAKSTLLTEEILEMCGFDVFKTEILFYGQLVPKYKCLEEICNVPVNQRLLLPKYYGGDDETPKEIIVFENLAERGFKDFDRFVCYDWNYASACIEQLAILHSLSIAYAEKYPEEFEQITKHLATGLSIQNMEQFQDATTAASLNATNEKYKEKLEKFMKNMKNTETFEKFTKPERRPCLIHGDFRPNNILHRVEKSGKIQVAILDHQFMQPGNPLFDLIYFIFMGSDTTFRAKYFYKLLDHYYENFSKSLIRLGVCPDKVYSKKDFDADVKLFLPFGLVISVLLLPILTIEKSKVPSTSDFLQGFGQKIWEDNYDLKERLNEIVTDFVEMGLL